MIKGIVYMKNLYDFLCIKYYRFRIYKGKFLEIMRSLLVRRDLLGFFKLLVDYRKYCRLYFLIKM